MPEPEAKPGQVVVRVFATSYNPIDSKEGFRMMRQMSPLTFPFLLGPDISGIVASLGAGVESF